MAIQNETINILVLMATQFEFSGWENNMKKVDMAMFSWWPLLARNISWKIKTWSHILGVCSCLGLYIAGTTVVALLC